MTRRLTFTLVIILATTSAQATDIPYATAQEIGVINTVKAAYPGDMDGDGDLDVVGITALSNDIVWYANGGDAGTWTSNTIATGFDGRRGAVVDMDGDGDLDVLGGAHNGGGATWWENLDGSATSWTAHAINDAVNASTIAAGDLDSDGDLDVVGKSHWWRNDDGTGTTWSEASLGVSLGAVAIGDLDGDGDIDFAGTVGNVLRWWNNTSGDATTLTNHTFGDLFEGSSVAIADVNGDGAQDVVGSGRGGKVAWWEWTGPNPEDWTEHTVDDTVSGSRWVRATDLDADGDIDLLVNALDDSENLWFENTAGDGSAWTEWQIDSGMSLMSSLEPTDLDGDGDLDTLGTVSNDTILWWENLTLHRSALFPMDHRVDNAFDGAKGATLGDIDGDGDLDIVAGTSFADDVAWWENGGGPAPTWTRHDIDTSFTDPRSLAVVDVDSDGDMDVICSDWSSQEEVVWWENDGTPGDGEWAQYQIATRGAIEIHVVDLDGDTDPDIVGCGGGFRDDLVWWEHDGTPADGAWAMHIIDDSAAASIISSADVDGDGDTDVLSASFGNNDVWWWENDGTPAAGTWTGTNIKSGWSMPSDVGAVDLDRDGDMDVVASATGANEGSWFENLDGDGQTWTTRPIATNIPDSSFLLVGDLDGDGDSDAVTAGSTNNTLVWHENLIGDGSSWLRHEIDTSGWPVPREVLIGDLDGDSDLDMVTLDDPISHLSWWENLGGQFALPTADAVADTHPTEGTEVAVLSVDLAHRGRSGDDDAELVTLELLFEASPGTPLSGTELEALTDALTLYLDNGNGTWGVEDSAIHAVTPPYTLASGVMTAVLPDDSADLQTAVGAYKTYFLTLELAASSGSANPDTLVVSHLTASSSTGEMASTDIPLHLEYHIDTASTSFEVNAVPVLDTPIGSQSATEGEDPALDVSVAFSDPDGDTLTFSATGLPSSLHITAAGVITGLPSTADLAGSPYTVTVTATDTWGAFTDDTFSLSLVDDPDALFVDGFESGDTSAWSMTVGGS